MTEPDAPDKPRVIVLAPGWGESAASMAGLVALLRNLGFVVKVVEYPRTTNKLPARELHVAAFLKAADETPGLVIGFGHSMGCLEIVEAARRQPDKFSQLILANPSGSVPPKALPRLAVSFVRNAFHNKPDQFRIAWGIARQNPGLVLDEARFAAASDIRELLLPLAQKGIGINILATTEDALYDIRLVRHLGTILHQGIRFIEARGYHDSIHLTPENYRAELKVMLRT